MHWFKLKMIVTLIALCSACTSTTTSHTNVTIDFPATESIQSVVQADTVLAAVTLSRAQIDWRFRQKEQICYHRFFMNACMKEAKDQRRTDLARVKKSEVAANYFKRKNTVEEMDKALVERNPQHRLPGVDLSTGEQESF